VTCVVYTRGGWESRDEDENATARARLLPAIMYTPGWARTRRPSWCALIRRESILSCNCNLEEEAGTQGRQGAQGMSALCAFIRPRLKEPHARCKRLQLQTSGAHGCIGCSYRFQAEFVVFDWV
jgi:hypothetical protein